MPLGSRAFALWPQEIWPEPPGKIVLLMINNQYCSLLLCPYLNMNFKIILHSVNFSLLRQILWLFIDTQKCTCTSLWPELIKLYDETRLNVTVYFPKSFFSISAIFSKTLWETNDHCHRFKKSEIHFVFNYFSRD